MLIHDAQYFPDDFPAKSGWGHTCYESVVELAIQAKVKHLCLFSHDHRRGDEEIAQMLSQVTTEIQRQHSPLKVFAARELSCFSLGGHG